MPASDSAVFCLSQAVKESNSYDTALWRCGLDGSAFEPIPGTEGARSFCCPGGARRLGNCCLWKHC